MSKATAALVAVLVLSPPAAALAPQGGGAGKSRRERPTTVRLSPRALRKTAVACKVPAYPRHLHGRRHVDVEIIFDEGGAVRGAKAVSGHPLLQASAVQAAWRWRFRPVKVKGRTERGAGRLRLFFSAVAAEMEKQCDDIARAP